VRSQSIPDVYCRAVSHLPLSSCLCEWVSIHVVRRVWTIVGAPGLHRGQQVIARSELDTDSGAWSRRLDRTRPLRASLMATAAMCKHRRGRCEEAWRRLRAGSMAHRQRRQASERAPCKRYCPVSTKAQGYAALPSRASRWCSKAARPPSYACRGPERWSRRRGGVSAGGVDVEESVLKEG
jgi:hypothetical protein